MVVAAVKAIILKLVYGVDLTENNLQTKRGGDKFAGQSFRTMRASGSNNDKPRVSIIG